MNREDAKKFIDRLEFCKAWAAGRKVEVSDKSGTIWVLASPNKALNLSNPVRCYRIVREVVKVERFAVYNVNDAPPCFINDFPNRIGAQGYIDRNCKNDEYVIVPLEGTLTL
jgi:hypothetical protein